MINKLTNMLSSEYGWFVGARMIAVLVKPVLLWVCLLKGYVYTAETLALWYLVTGTLMVVFNNEAHFDFYKLYFSDDSKRIAIHKKEIVYYRSLAIHYFIFCGPVFFGVYLYTYSIWLSAVFFILLFLEKIFDELQRFLQFRKKFKLWSKIVLAQILVPFFCVMLSIYFSQKDRYTLYIFLFSYLLILIICLSSLIKLKQWKVGFDFLFKIRLSDFKNYYFQYKQRLGLNQLQSFTSRNVVLFDRFLIKILNVGMLAPFTIIAQMGSFPILFIDYFLLSYRRKRYIEEKENINSIVSPSLLVFFGVVSYIIFFVVIYFIIGYFNIEALSKFSEHLIYLIGLYYVIYAISMHFSQFNFWNKARKFTLSIDAVFFVGVLVVIWISPYELELNNLILGLIIGHVIRLILMCLLALSKNAKFKYV